MKITNLFVCPRYVGEYCFTNLCPDYPLEDGKKCSCRTCSYYKGCKDCNSFSCIPRLRGIFENK